jgi:hypothetical protein
MFQTCLDIYHGQLTLPVYFLLYYIPRGRTLLVIVMSLFNDFNASMTAATADHFLGFAHDFATLHSPVPDYRCLATDYYTLRNSFLCRFGGLIRRW